MTTVKYREWEFEVDKESTSATYKRVSGSGADTCVCSECKNYVAYRDSVFPDEVKMLFNDLSIDYRKEVQITTWEILPSGLHHIGGWFHFKGRILTGKDCRVPFQSGGFTFNLRKINDNLLIGFSPGDDLTFFKDEDALVQIEFETNIPWVIDKSLEVASQP